ncbi:MAG: hypothetical protein U0893_14735 [Chloroflexota bacterium]
MPDDFAPVPGDAVLLPDNQRATVQTVYLCSEPGLAAGDEVTRWSWIVLTDGRLLEVAPRGCALYDAPDVLVRGGGPFLALVAQDGALVRFEERVRDGSWERRPVRLSLGGRRWRVTSTGTVSAQRLGPVPASPWDQLRGGSQPAAIGSPRPQPLSPEPDVYFTFVATNDADALGLGVWMTDICLAFGRRLGDSPKDAGLRIARPD